jgi:6-phosphogluconolactonase
LLNNEQDELITINIALDQILCYQLTQGVPSLANIIPMPKDVGPRHAIYSADEAYLYVITEYSNEIFVYENETRELLQRISTLRSEYRGISNCSTLCTSKDGKYLYAANRGADTITQFSVTSGGRLNFLQDYSCGGKHPRHMILTKKGDLLIICNQHSNHVVAYIVEEVSGRLGEKVFELEFLSPSGVLEV